MKIQTIKHLILTLITLSTLISVHAAEDPRTPISEIPYTINERGSYYLTKNLFLNEVKPELISTSQTGHLVQQGKFSLIPSKNQFGRVIGVAESPPTELTSLNGITINTGGVTLDLNGFSIVGGSRSNNGIHVPVQVENLTIRNGIIQDWGGNGVYARKATLGKFVDLHTSSNGEKGLEGGSGSIVKNCISSFNDSYGIYIDNGVVDRCIANNNNYAIYAGRGSSVLGCTALNNDGDGISVSDGSVIVNCSSVRNDGDGIDFDNGNSIVNCASHQNGQGYYGKDGNVLKNCTASENDRDGIDVDRANTIVSCTMHDNGDEALRKKIHSIVDQNAVD